MSKSKANKTTALTVNGQFTREQVPSLLEVVNKKIQALKGEESSPTRISKSLGNFGVISNINKSSDLINAYSYITAMEERYNQILPAFKKAVAAINPPAFMFEGHTAKQWQEDILIQYRQVTYKDELDKLAKVKSKLEGLLSEEDKVAAEMQNIAELLKS